MSRAGNILTLSGVTSTFKVADISVTASADPLCGSWSIATRASLTAIYSKYVCAYGVLIVGTAAYPDENMLYAANLVANVLDPESTGKVKDSALRAKID